MHGSKKDKAERQQSRLRSPIGCQMREYQLQAINVSILNREKRSPRTLKLTSTTALHHLIVSLHIRRNEDNLCPETFPCIFDKLHGIRSPTAYLRVPQYHSVGLNMLVYKPQNSLPERLFHIRPDPNQKPVRTLDTRRQRCPNARARAHANPPSKHSRRMPNPRKLKLPRP